MGRICDLDLKGGKFIGYGCEYFVFENSLEAQKDSLTEDICFIEYENGYSIDISWFWGEKGYGEFSRTSSFVISIIRGTDWENPFKTYESLDLLSLKQNLLKAVDIVSELKNLKETDYYNDLFLVGTTFELKRNNKDSEIEIYMLVDSNEYNNIFRIACIKGANAGKIVGNVIQDDTIDHFEAVSELHLIKEIQRSISFQDGSLKFISIKIERDEYL